ncbi:hypothetical protein NS506_02830 [Nocardia seriolae]|uniref:Uncharacterized protein n=1 Tax=Nocardia seriolae TaxID=37332 RepID=A0ABC8AS16_9NOCA|nr:hypothetical protein [Nocardia seriolae]APA96890.1 hypothetical protein NS506_02830 [Nocardia seriolae]
MSVSVPASSSGLVYLEATSADVTGSDAAFATVERLRADGSPGIPE